MMHKFQTDPKHGKSARMTCARCGKPMRICRRVAHPSQGPEFELQTFICRACGYEETRDAPSPGGAG